METFIENNPSVNIHFDLLQVSLNGQGEKINLSTIFSRFPKVKELYLDEMRLEIDTFSIPRNLTVFKASTNVTLSGTTEDIDYFYMKLVNQCKEVSLNEWIDD